MDSQSDRQMQHLLRALIVSTSLLRMPAARQEHGHTIRGTDETPAEGIDRVNEFAEDVFKTRACTHNQGRARGTDETPAESVDRVNVLAENACCKTVL